jgi:pyruvate dehydrogenase E2 component (dihydrolipoamide acetyltransferase)
MTLAAEGIDCFHLIGHSLGGAIAATLAARTSSDVRSLLLLAPAGLGPDINGAFLAGYLRATSEASLTPWLRELAVDSTVLNSAFVNAVLRQRKEGVGASQALIASALFPNGTQAFSIRHLFANFAIPTRVVVGVEDRIIPARYAFGLPGTIALHAFAGIGHLPHLEIRPEVARIARELLLSAD